MQISSDNVPAELISVHSPKATASEAYRGLRTSLLLSSADEKPRVIMVTSAGPLEGKTLTSSNLAVTMAGAHESVLLIDGDMRRPRVHKVFQTANKKGLSGILVGTDKMADAVVETPVKGLYLLPVGVIPPNPSELIGSRTMGRLLSSLKEKFEIIVIDTPPMTAVTDALVLSQFVDGVMLVTRTNITPRQVIKSSLEQLRTAKASILGVVLNGVNTGKDSYYYSQYYYNYYADDGDKKRRRGKQKRHKGGYA